ncbi:hypothetical protein WVIC16_60028 [Weissella viridescens]|nr:hypothetical protein WVIC16_60028 [Weissella viridescens]
MPKLSKLQQRVYDLLPRGAERPRPQTELIYLVEQSEQFKVTPRLISQIINDLIIKHHIPIDPDWLKPYRANWLLLNRDTARITECRTSVKSTSKCRTKAG